ncbi:MAG: sortase [Clostridia bacterium]|nr:sortase [Clostridia bacterium]
MNNDLENDLRNPEPRGGMTKKTVAEVISKVAAYVGKGGNAALSLFSGLLAAVLILYSGYVLYDTFYTENEAYSAWDVLKQYRPDFTDIEDSEVPTSTWDSMSEITPNYRAWVTIYDTTIDYPIVQGEDDLYYAMHNIYGESSLTGAIYLAAANTPDFSDNYNLLYGHHMDNGAMFGNLDLFMEREYFDAHREGILVTKDKVYDFTIFASIKTDAYAGEAYDLGGNKNLNALKIFIENNALIYDAEASWTPEKVLAFSTCASATTNGRLLVYASLTEREIIVPETTPPETNPPETNPPETEPGETEPPETEPGETEPPETTPAGIEPVEPEPGETEPREPEPGETEPTEPEPGETEPTEPEPGETEPREPEQGETEPREPEPGETEPRETEPRETEPPIEDIPEEETPLEGLIRRLTPTGSSWYRRGAWALVNLIALIATAYILLPLLRLKGKYGRAKKMKNFNGVKEDLWDAEDMTPDDVETREMIPTSRWKNMK